MTTNESFNDLFRRIGVKLRQRGDQLIAELGLNAEQGRTIAYIAAQQEKGVIQRDLADISGRRSASVTNVLQGLEEKGYIERRTSKDDERKKTLCVLPKGKAIIDEFQTMMEQLEQELLVPLTQQERTTLLALLRKIDSNFTA